MSRVQSQDEIVIDFEQAPEELSDEQIEALLDAAEHRIGGEFGRLISELRQSSAEGDS